MTEDSKKDLAALIHGRDFVQLNIEYFEQELQLERQGAFELDILIENKRTERKKQ